MASESDQPSGTSGKCPVYFCGPAKSSSGFASFFSNAQKVSTIEAREIAAVGQTVEKIKDLEFGVVVLLLVNKNDLVAALNTLVALKKRLDSGVLRVLVYNLLENDKLATVLKSKGCTETLNDGLSQKALMHKLQRHIQLVATKFKSLKKNQGSDTTALKASVKSNSSDRPTTENAKIKFIQALTDPNDCWLVKNKRDFKYIRGNWIGELIGPGPGVGSWTEAGGTTNQPLYRWTARNPLKGDEVDPFVPGKGSWFCAGRKPEFDWKSNRWRFVGETPSLFYRAPDAAKGSGAIFRFRSQAPGTIDVALNSVAAKGKLKAIIATFDDEKLIKEDKKKKLTEKEIALDKEKKKARGADYEGDLSPDEDPAEWGELKEGEEEARKWGDLKESEEEEKREWDDRSDEGEEEGGADWSGLDIGKGNKFNSGRGLGQGDGGKKGYKPEKEESKERSEEEDDEHDWTGLDVGRGNKFTSGRGVGQGAGKKGYKYDKDGNEVRSSGREEVEDEDEDLDDDDLEQEDEGEEFEELDLGDVRKERKRAKGGQVSQEAKDSKESFDALLGDPALESEWETGANAFEKITLDISVSRPDAPGSAALGDVSILERQGFNLLLDAPSSSFTLGERVSFAVVLGELGQKKKLQLTGKLETMQSSGDNRDIILVTVTEISRPHLAEIQNVFEKRQEQLLKFLREAKG